MLALAAMLCACNKAENTVPEIPTPDVDAPVFTATIEGVGSKATLGGMTPRWAAGDEISVDGFAYKALSEGTSSTFTAVSPIQEIRPAYVTGGGKYQQTSPDLLVDEAGIDTEWSGHMTDPYIVVSTAYEYKLYSIKLWNGSDPTSIWKSIAISGSSSSQGPWTGLKTIDDLKLQNVPKGYGGENVIDAAIGYKYYLLNVFSTVSSGKHHMSDMKFMASLVESDQYDAYFPRNLYRIGTSALPSDITETWAKDKFNMPMYASSTTTDLQFKNLCAVLKIVVKDNELKQVKGIKVSSANKAMSGEFTVSDNAAVLKSPDDVAKTVTVTYENAVPTTAEGVAFYVAIPAQTYRNLKVQLSNDGTDYTFEMMTKDGVDIVVERNRIYQITMQPGNSEAYTFVPVEYGDEDFDRAIF